MTVDFAEWRGRLGGRSDPINPPVIQMPLKPSPRGGSGTFLAADDAGKQWWVKPLNNRQGERVTVTESIVASVGALIDAPVCDIEVVFLPPEIAGWEFRAGASIESGFAHASRAVPSAVEHRSLRYREQDDNIRRHVGAIAIYDWCWGGDYQWLYAETEDRKLYSHDHGWYLPENGAEWSVDGLKTHVGQPHVLGCLQSDVDAAEAGSFATRLQHLQPQTIADTLRRIPASWPVSDAELERVGWFLECRAPEVAARLVEMGDRQ
ncbi:MAG: hypothetical protein OXE04_01770 [bacterium]|nr:hypothetical protein [bacterium]MCY4257007.1 hypothetical protein [bacterium]